MDFEKFLENFTKVDNYYIPKDLSLNEYRHFGIKKDNQLYLNIKELKYLFYKSCEKKIENENCSKKLKTNAPVEASTILLKILAESDLETKSYFDLKDSGYNVLFQEDERQYLYHKKKHFNREKDMKLAELEYTDRDEMLLSRFNCTEQDTSRVFGVLGENEFTFLEVKQVETLDMETNEKLYKKKNIGEIIR